MTNHTERESITDIKCLISAIKKDAMLFDDEQQTRTITFYHDEESMIEIGK